MDFKIVRANNKKTGVRFGYFEMTKCLYNTTINGTATFWYCPHLMAPPLFRQGNENNLLYIILNNSNMLYSTTFIIYFLIISCIQL